MKPRISFITLGVTDLPRMTAFYKDGLGLPLRFQNDHVAFFQLHGPLILALFLNEELLKDIGADAGDVTRKAGGNDGVSPEQTFRGFTMAHNVTSPDQVDGVLREAERAGGTIVKLGEKAFWGGYTGYFADPEGFHWEVAYNPDMPEFASDAMPPG